jgi:hypothetical protein
MLWIDRVGNRRSWAILARYFSVENWGQAQRKKKGPKKKENGGLWKLTPLWKSAHNADSHSGLESTKRFPQFPQGPTAILQT